MSFCPQWVSEGAVADLKTKKIVRLYLIILSIGTILSLYIPKSEVVADEPVVIPNEAIRLRILANSDSETDQAIKRLIRDAVNEEITEWVEELTSIEEARSLIRSRLPKIQQIVEKVLEEEQVNQPVKIDFGKVDFPTKLYGQYLYPAGEYEAILITLGDGEGANWWCVLFPPLCFLDFSNGVAVSDGVEEEDVQVSDTESNSKEVEVAENVSINEEKESQEQSQSNEKSPVFVKEEDKEVEVKFFVVELWEKLLD